MAIALPRPTRFSNALDSPGPRRMRAVLRFAVVAMVAAATYSAALHATLGMTPVVRGAIMALVAFLDIGVVVVTLERTIAGRTPAAMPRSERQTDTCWWFVGYGTRFAADITTTASIALLIRMLPNHPAGMTNTQPFWLQLVEALLIGDFCQYWAHRWLHRPVLWAIHAIHHSPENVTWLSTTRIHPLETIIRGPIEMAPLYFLGFSTVSTLPLITIALGLYEVFLHANVAWDFGPIRFVIASPAFHRWHHTAEKAGFDKNFAGLFPVYDIIFGTFRLPNRESSSYGLGGGVQMAPSFRRQMAHPLRSAISETDGAAAA